MIEMSTNILVMIWTKMRTGMAYEEGKDKDLARKSVLSLAQRAKSLR
jgi:hypothetical protein